MLRVARVLLLVAIAVSIVDYVDNTVNYAAYPRPTSGPAPSQGVIAPARFICTAFGIAGYVFLTRARVTGAAICLAVYSGSGLIGIGHYTVPGATSMVWWRQAHIVADIACGVAVFAFAVWLARRERAVSRGSAGGGLAANPEGSP